MVRHQRLAQPYGDGGSGCTGDGPFSGLLYLGSLQTVPEELQRAARVDGAGSLRRFFAVTVPWVKRTTFLVSVLGVIAGFTMFVLVYILTSGGPALATNVLPYFAYTTSFVDLNWGVGSALFFLIAVSIFIISAFLYLLGTLWPMTSEAIGSRVAERGPRKIVTTTERRDDWQRWLGRSGTRSRSFSWSLLSWPRFMYYCSSV